jgi:hypothetical protein
MGWTEKVEDQWEHLTYKFQPLPFLLSTCCHYSTASYCVLAGPSYSSAVLEESNCGAELSLYYYAVPLLVNREGKEREERGEGLSRNGIISTTNKK